MKSIVKLDVGCVVPETYKNTMNLEQENRLFIGNLSHNISNEDVENLFSRCGPIISSVRRRNCAIIRFEDARDAQDALELDGYKLGDNRISVERYRKAPMSASKSKKKTRLFIGKLPYNVNREDVEIFSPVLVQLFLVSEDIIMQS